MRFRTHTRTTSTLELDDDMGEVELRFQPYYEDYIEVKQLEDGRIKVGYLVHDDSCGNPMKENDCEGELYTKESYYARDSSITDDNAALRNALGLDPYGGIDEDREFQLDGETLNLSILAERLYWNERPHLRHEADDDEIAPEHDEAIRQLAEELYAKHWRRIAGWHVVPVDYCASNHGPGTTTVRPTDWDGDVDDLPSGVWVACDCAKDNIEAVAVPAGVEIKRLEVNDVELIYKGERIDIFTGSGAHGRAREFAIKRWGQPNFDDLCRAAFDYAKGVLEEYQNWCNGDCYGCVVQTFKREGDEWVEDGDSDSCWGYIGSDYALQTLREEYL